MEVALFLGFLAHCGGIMIFGGICCWLVFLRLSIFQVIQKLLPQQEKTLKHFNSFFQIAFRC